MSNLLDTVFAACSSATKGQKPKNCVDVRHHTQAKRTYILENDPQLIRMLIRQSHDLSPLDGYTLSIPRTLWLVVFNDSYKSVTAVYLVGAAHPYEQSKLETPIFALPFPNLQQRGHANVCTNTTYATALNTHTNRRTGEVDEIGMVGGYPELILNSYWNNHLTYDLASAGLTSFADWAAKSEKDPEFYKQLKLTPHRNKTVSGLIKQFIDPNIGFPVKVLPFIAQGI